MLNPCMCTLTGPSFRVQGLLISEGRHTCVGRRRRRPRQSGVLARQPHEVPRRQVCIQQRPRGAARAPQQLRPQVVRGLEGGGGLVWLLRVCCIEEPVLQDVEVGQQTSLV